MKLQWRKMFIIVAVIVLLLLVTGCTSSRPAFTDVLDRAASAAAGVQTYRADVTSVYKEDGEEHRNSIKIEFVVPDRYRTISTGDAGSEEAIVVGQVMYTLDSTDNTWRVRQWPGLTDAFLMERFIDKVGSLVEITELVDEEVDGINCYHYRGSVDSEEMFESAKANLDSSQPTYEAQLKSLEVMLRWQIDYEFWLGREDYLLHQQTVTQEIIMPGDETKEENEEHYRVDATYHFYDFNAPITVEPPLDLVEGVYLSVNSVSSIGGSEDLQHQLIKYEITVDNGGIQTARDVRVFIDTPATNEGQQTMEATPERSPVGLEAGEHAAYEVSWEYDMSQSSKEELAALMEQNTIWASWTDENGGNHGQVLSGRSD